MNRLGYPTGSTSVLVAKALWRALGVAEGAGAAEVFIRGCGVESRELDDETAVMPLGNVHRLLKRFVERRGRAAVRELASTMLEPELLAAWVPVLRGVDRVADALARVGSAESDERRTQRWESVTRSDGLWVGRLIFQHDPELEVDGLLAEHRRVSLASHWPTAWT